MLPDLISCQTSQASTAGPMPNAESSSQASPFSRTHSWLLEPLSGQLSSHTPNSYFRPPSTARALLMRNASGRCCFSPASTSCLSCFGPTWPLLPGWQHGPREAPTSSVNSLQSSSCSSEGALSHGPVDLVTPLLNVPQVLFRHPASAAEPFHQLTMSPLQPPSLSPCHPAPQRTAGSASLVPHSPPAHCLSSFLGHCERLCGPPVHATFSRKGQLIFLIVQCALLQSPAVLWLSCGCHSCIHLSCSLQFPGG